MPNNSVDSTPKSETNADGRPQVYVSGDATDTIYKFNLTTPGTHTPNNTTMEWLIVSQIVKQQPKRYDIQPATEQNFIELMAKVQVL